MRLKEFIVTLTGNLWCVTAGAITLAAFQSQDIAIESAIIMANAELDEDVRTTVLLEADGKRAILFDSNEVPDSQNIGQHH